MTSVLLGDTVTTKYQASQNSDNELNWYQQTPEKSPKLLIYASSRLYAAATSRFSGSGPGTDFTLTISNIEPEDIATYYCKWDINYPCTVEQIIA